ncbi:Phosphoesterase HXTX [Caldalkalibacillus thermarum TA2.A1]|uniref:Putative phosphoesterase CathTA2_0861 n=1 Tax=Caldalkalibacillus thermarum (strain TA2.A1) TaxID=986075 RepID=F5L4Z8_CALTT|nr:YjcG family protein [Caldalkalibacillus thermarum]EGL83574.1 Phosphoesterase HXTX [Caldalkalibacillus thermarum TA2.A1]QZT35127.1 YjcG family protein [Caldalkalibacillus thermarum TA2.A1]GGK12684.1 putative phosphoesterase [Caldalkalibacillus thermarum]
MNLGIAIFPPKNIQDLANSFRKRYDPRYSLIAPHITIKEAFEANEDQLPEIVQYLRQVAQETEPIPLHIYKVSHFHPTNNVLYLAIKEEPLLTALHNKLHEPPLMHERKYPFVPHITIGQEMSDDELHDVYGRLRMKTFEFTFTATRFHLLYQLENEAWTTYETFLLGQKV